MRIDYRVAKASSNAQCTCMFSVYESGSCFSPDVLDITSEDILSRFVDVSRPGSVCPSTIAFAWSTDSILLATL